MKGLLIRQQRVELCALLPDNFARQHLVQLAAVALEYFHHAALQRGYVGRVFGMDNHVGRIVDYDRTLRHAHR